MKKIVVGSAMAFLLLCGAGCTDSERIPCDPNATSTPGTICKQDTTVSGNEWLIYYILWNRYAYTTDNKNMATEQPPKNYVAPSNEEEEAQPYTEPEEETEPAMQNSVHEEEPVEEHYSGGFHGEE